MSHLLIVDDEEAVCWALERAEAFTRAGELGEAVWEYLAVLEIDPDNATARRQVGKVATAVRQFDNTAPGRRWFKRIRKQTRFRRWSAQLQEGEANGWLSGLLWFLLIFGTLLIGYYLGVRASHAPGAQETPSEKPEKVENKVG